MIGEGEAGEGAVDARGLGAEDTGEVAQVVTDGEVVVDGAALRGVGDSAPQVTGSIACNSKAIRGLIVSESRASSLERVGTLMNPWRARIIATILLALASGCSGPSDHSVTARALPTTMPTSRSTLRVDPVEQCASATFAVTILQDSTADTQGAQVELSFDATLVNVVDVTAGTTYAGAALAIGKSGQTKEDAIAEANERGVLGVGTLLDTSAHANPPGVATFLVLTMSRVPGARGVTPLVLSSGWVSYSTGERVPAMTQSGSVTVEDRDCGT